MDSAFAILDLQEPIAAKQQHLQDVLITAVTMEFANLGSAFVLPDIQEQTVPKLWIIVQIHAATMEFVEMVFAIVMKDSRV